MAGYNKYPQVCFYSSPVDNQFFLTQESDCYSQARHHH